MSGWNGWEIIRSGGTHLLGLINDILDLSKVDAGKLDVEAVDCSPVELVEEVGAILRTKAEEKGLALTIAFDGPLPESIRTDPTRFRQVLMNIAGNAIKFTPSGRVEIAARLDRPAGGSPKLIVRITDSGIGIPAEKLSVIFNPFTQADSSITRQFGGSGLGLAISRRLAELLGGGVTVESRVGEGDDFHLRIRRRLVGRRAVDRESRRPGRSGSGRPGHLAPAGARSSHPGRRRRRHEPQIDPAGAGQGRGPGRNGRERCASRDPGDQRTV